MRLILFLDTKLRELTDLATPVFLMCGMVRRVNGN